MDIIWSGLTIDVVVLVNYILGNISFDENQIINNLKKIPEVPITIIHGRSDLTCLPESSYLLSKLLVNSKLVLVSNAGHLAGEPGITNALIQATDEMTDLLNE